MPLKLKKYTLEGSAKCVCENIIWISIQETKDTDGLINRFIEWCHKEHVYSVVGGTIGGGMLSEGFNLRDKDKILEWLYNNNVKINLKD